MARHVCPEPIGPREIEEILGVTRERVAQLRRRPDFPKPMRWLATGVIYDAHEIEAWAKADPRRKGFTTYVPKDKPPD